MRTIEVAFGALDPSLTEQLDAQSLKCPREKLVQFEKSRDALNLLRIHGLLTDSQSRMAETKLFKRIRAEVSNEQEREPCVACGGSGIGGEVSRDMAIDACMPGVEGQEVPCSFCNGDGWF